MVERVDSLLEELAEWHRNEPEFVAQLRPMIARIFDSGTPEEFRPRLLEMVAETCDRQVAIKRNGEERSWFELARDPEGDRELHTQDAEPTPAVDAVSLRSPVRQGAK